MRTTIPPPVYLTAVPPATARPGLHFRPPFRFRNPPFPLRSPPPPGRAPGHEDSAGLSRRRASRRPAAVSSRAKGDQVMTQMQPRIDRGGRDEGETRAPL